MTIFNQEFTNKRSRFRDGSVNDVEYLTATFKRFGMEPDIKPDLKFHEIVNEIHACKYLIAIQWTKFEKIFFVKLSPLVSKADFSTHKLFVCVYMSHGERNGIVSAADKEFNCKDIIIDPIMRNASLNGIPKIFIMVACRGDSDYYECDGEEFDGHILSTANSIDYSNRIISYSTYEGKLYLHLQLFP